MGILDIFTRKKTSSAPSLGTKTNIKLINDYDNFFTNFSGELYEDSTARACIDCIAKHTAKLTIKHLGSAPFTDIILTAPNDIQTSYDFIYKIVTNLFVRNNVFIEIKRVAGRVTALIPIDYSSVEIDNSGAFVYFRMLDGSEAVADYKKDIIHLRRHYDKSFFGSSAIDPITNNLNAINTANEGIVNAVKNGGRLRGLLKYSNSLREADKLSAKVEFENNYLRNNDNGIGILDSKAEFIELSQGNFKTIDAEQMAELRKQMYIFFGVSEEILTGTYTEDQFNAFYSSTIEPVAIQMSLEFTKKIFTENEINHGNKIVFSADRLIFANNATKATMINTLLPLGVMSVNEARIILELEELEEDRRLVSLNYVNFDNADQYQLGNNTNTAGGDNSEGNKTSDD